MKKGFLWLLSVLAGVIVILSVMIVGYYILNSGAEPVATTIENHSSTKSSETNSTTTTSNATENTTTASSTEKISEPVSEQGMNLSEMKSGDFSSIAGRWVNKNGNIIDIEASGKMYTEGAVNYPIQGFTISNDNTASAYLNRNLTDGMAPSTRDYVTFIPASVSIAGGNTADVTKDRIGLNGTVEGYNDPQVYYRDSENPMGIATEKDYMMAYAVDTIEKYRKDVNRSLAERKDYIADSFTSKDNSYYLETVDYILNQSAKDGIKSYDSTTDSITDFQYTNDTITFTLNYTTTTNYTDGRPSTTDSFTRYYTLKYVDGVFLIEKF
ncbi:DUF6287 domain-containing protein [Streptococcus hyovaginalis]